MKNYINRFKLCLLCLICIGFLNRSDAQQIVAMEYFFDTDPGFSNGIAIPINPDTNILNKTVPINFGLVSTGLHNLYIRSKDDSGHWSLTNRSSFYKSGFLVDNSIHPIASIEYFIDSDPGFGNGIQLAINADTSINNLTSNINLLGLTSGNHTIYIRSKDSLGRWSLTNRANFVYCTSGTNTFYADADGDGYGNNSQTIIACTLPTGYSTNNMDCDDNNSLVHQTFPFYLDLDGDGYGTGTLIQACTSSANNPPPGYSMNHDDCDDSNDKIYPGTIDQVEYFIDSDPSLGQGNAITINPVSIDSVFTSASINIPNNLSNGHHVLSTRAHACQLGWGLFEHRSFYVTPSDIQTGPLVSGELFFDTDPGMGNGIAFSVPSSDTVNQTLSINIPKATSPGTHLLGIRIKDSLGQWSHFYHGNVTILPPLLDYPPIIAAEYFIDTDPGIGNGIPLNVIPGDTISPSFAIPMPSNLHGGVHLLAIRTKDSLGNWGLFENRSFIIEDSGPLYNPIVAAEYFVDTDPGVGNGTQISISQADTLTENINLSIPASLLTNAHKIAFRVKNLNGEWSFFDLPPIPIFIKTFVQGYYHESGLMRPVLFNQGQNNSTNEVDTMYVDIHQPTFPYTTAYSTKGILQVNGQLSVSVPSSYQGQLFYVALRHRSAIETWSAAPLSLNLYDNAYDFTTASSKAYGNNLTELDTNVWAMYSGDANQDENIDLLDASLMDTHINTFQFGYLATDINGDGNVDLLDTPILETNINGFEFSNHP